MTETDIVARLRPHPRVADDASVMYRAGDIRQVFTHITRLEERCAALTGQVEAGASEIEQMQAAKPTGPALPQAWPAPPPEPAKAEVVDAEKISAEVHRLLLQDGEFWQGWPKDLIHRIVTQAVLNCNATPPTAPVAAEVAETPAPSWFAAEVDRASEAHARYEATLPSSAAPVAARSAAWKPTHRHVKSGRLERVIGEAEAQVSTGLHIVDIDAHGVCEAWSRQVADGDRLTVYEGADGKLWVRFTDEFNDGRFVALPLEQEA